MSIESWGFHLMINGAAADINSIKDYDKVMEFTKNLVKEIDMTPYGDPEITNFGEGNKSGFTVLQKISTSNIGAHLCNETGDIYWDVFSCKDFDKNKVIQLIQETFKPKAISSMFVFRTVENGIPTFKVE